MQQQINKSKAGFCIIKGHESYTTQYICTLKECKLTNKWICAECQLQDLHLHKQQTNSHTHMMKQKDFLELITKQANPYLDWKKSQKIKISESIQILKNSIQLIKDLIKQLHIDFSKIQEYDKSYEIQKIIRIAKDNFFSLSNEQIRNALNCNFINAKFDQQISSDITKSIIKQYQDLLMLIQGNNKQEQNNRQNSMSLSQSVNMKQSQVNMKQSQVNMKQSYQLQTQQSFTLLKFENYKEINQTSHIQTTQISKDERYLVIGGYDKKLHIFDMDSAEMIKQIQLDNVVFICRFTNDSRFLICGDIQGFIYSYDVNNDFKELFCQKVHQDWINDIISIDNDSIMSCSDDKSIIITNFKQNRQILFIEKAHQDFIKGIDYDQSQDIIISCSADKSIKLFYRKNGKLQFEQQNAHENIIHQIQLLENNSNLLSSDNLSLSLWQIDYDQRQLTKIKTLQQWNINFTSVSNNQRIVLICKESIKLLDNNLKVNQTIEHQISEFYCNFIQYIIVYFRTRQLNSINNIIIPGKCIIFNNTQNVLNLQKDNEYQIGKRHV